MFSHFLTPTQTRHLSKVLTIDHHNNNTIQYATPALGSVFVCVYIKLIDRGNGETIYLY